MVNSETVYLDSEFKVEGQDPSTLDELKSLIGEQAIIDECISNLYYRNKYPRVYDKVSKAVVAAGFPRAVKEEKTLKSGEVRKVHISEMDHLRAYLKTNAEDNTVRTQLQELFHKYNEEEPLYVKGERTGGGGKIAQGTLDAANGFFAEGIEVVEEKVGIIESMVPGYKVGRDGDGNPTPETLARGIQALEKHLQNAAKKQAAGALGGKA